MPHILGKEVGPIGYGLMSFSWRDGQAPDDKAFEAMRTALENGLNFWNGGEFYGPEDANSLVLLKKYFTKYPEDSDKVVLSIKGGATKPYRMQFDSSPENVRRSVNDCVAQLKGHKKMDLFEVARHDGVTPWESTLRTLDTEFVQAGTINGISLSEVRSETIHMAANVTKISAVEVELSLMSTDVLTNGIAEACAKYDIPLIAYSPMGRGLLTGKLKSQDDIPDYLKRYPRFSPENFPINLQLVEQVEKIAKQKGCTPAQFAINWVRCQSKKPGMPTIIPIPGGGTVEKVIENSKIVDVTLEELAEIDAILSNFEVKGGRYPDYVPINT